MHKYDEDINVLKESVKILRKYKENETISDYDFLYSLNYIESCIFKLEYLKNYKKGN